MCVAVRCGSELAVYVCCCCFFPCVGVNVVVVRCRCLLCVVICRGLILFGVARCCLVGMSCWLFCSMSLVRVVVYRRCLVDVCG